MNRRPILCICLVTAMILTVAPFSIGGKPANNGKNSTLSGDFVSGPTPGGWARSIFWEVSETPGPVGSPAPGGPITIYDAPAGVGNQDSTTISWNSHGELLSFVGKDGGKISLSKLQAGTYYCPGDTFSTMTFRLEIYNYVIGDNNRVALTIMMQNDLLTAKQMKIVNEKTTVTVSGAGVPFIYEDWNQDQATFVLGTATHDFTMVIDK